MTFLCKLETKKSRKTLCLDDLEPMEPVYNSRILQRNGHQFGTYFFLVNCPFPAVKETKDLQPCLVFSGIEVVHSFFYQLCLSINHLSKSHVIVNLPSQQKLPLANLLGIRLALSTKFYLSIHVTRLFNLPSFSQDKKKSVVKIIKPSPLKIAQTEKAIFEMAILGLG